MKQLSILMFLLILLSCFLLVLLPWKADKTNNDFVFILPESLVTIENEAFEGIAAESIVSSNSLSYIGERAFANGQYLKAVSVPDSIKYIGDQAFAGNSSLTIYGSANSYAADWAREHDIMFVSSANDVDYSEEFSKSRITGLCSVLSLTCCSPDIMQHLRKRIKNAERSMRPQDRPELNPIDYRFP